MDGFLLIDTCGTADLPNGVDGLVVSVHHGCPGGSHNTIWCSDECSGFPCSGGLPCIRPEHVPVTAEESYLIRVSLKTGSEPGDFKLKTQFLPKNDACDHAFFIDVPSQTLGSTSRATSDGAPECENETQTAPGVWYKVMGTGRRINVATTNETDFDTKISVYCGGCGGLNCIAANDDYHPPEQLGSRVSWCSNVGVVYHVLVHGYQDDKGNFLLDAWDGGECPLQPNTCTPPNDTCSNPIVIGGDGTVEIMGDNTGSTTSGITASCQESTHDVWYSYRAACEGQVMIDTCQPETGSLTETVLSVYDGCGGNELACDFDTTAPCLGRASITLLSEPGQDFLIRVADAGVLQQDQGTFPLRITEMPHALVLADDLLPDAIQGQFYSAALQIFGGCPPYVLRSDDLPSGLRFRSKVIYGTPESSGEYVMNVTVEDNSGTPGDSGTITLRVLPSNDDFANAIPIPEGGLSFGTVGATTDGPNDSISCEMDSDIWYCYTSSCMGEATVSLCDSTYDTKLAVYHSCRYPTDNSGLIECNDDACSSQSEITFDVVAGYEYLIRVGGKDGTQGNGRLVVSCVNKPACCLPDGTCENMWPRTCVETYGGVSQDLYTTCATADCPQPAQACCFFDGSCEDLPPKSCLAQWGTPQGAGSTCASTSCEQAQACCLPDGSCSEMLTELCEALNGSSMGPGSTCATENCSLPVACCMGDGSCSDLSPEDCLAPVPASLKAQGVPVPARPVPNPRAVVMVTAAAKTSHLKYV